MAKAIAHTIERTEVKKKFNKKLNIYPNGVIDNNAPDENEEIIDNSVTAGRCANLTAEYILGQGFGEHNNIIVNNEGDTLFEVSEAICKDLGYHRGSYIHLNIGINSSNEVYIDSISHIPYTHGRVGKQDDRKHSGKIHVHDNWLEAKENDIDIIDVFNLNKNVVISQVQNSEGFKNYKGQIFFLNLDKNRIYPKSPLKSVIDYAYIQPAIGKLGHTSIQNGRFGTTLFITDEMIDPELDPNDKDDAKEIFKQKNEVSTFHENIGKTKGVNNAQTTMHIQSKKEAGESIKDSIHVQTIDSNINDKMFAETRKSAKEDICEAWRVPITLIKPVPGMFGQTGQAYQQIKLFFQEGLESPQRKFEQSMQKLMRRFREPKEIHLTKKITEYVNQ